MEWEPILTALGGGVPAVVIVGLAWQARNRQKRADDLTDRIIEMSINTANAMNELARQFERGAK